jgi:ribonuclease J
MGIPAENIFIADNGVQIELTENSIKKCAPIPAGQNFVDGSGVGDVGNVVLRDRKRLSEDGLIVVAASIDSYSGYIVAGPDILTRGFVYAKESEELLDDAREVARYAIENCLTNNIRDWNSIKSSVRDEVSRLMYERTKKSPMILSIIMEV